MDDIDDFVEYLIRENCEGCKVARINMDNVVGWIDADCIEQEERR